MKPALTSVAFFMALLLSLPAKAQIGQRSVEFRWSNDFFFQTDRDFTNGFDVSLYSKPLNGFFLNNILFSPKHAETQSGLTLTQHFYTPKNLFSYTIDKTDRPFASYLLAGFKKTGFIAQKGIRTESEIKAGIFGAYSGGHSIQNGIHSILPASEPAIGWNNQLKTDLALSYLFSIDKAIIFTQNAEFYFSGLARAGIPYTDLTTGFELRVHHQASHFKPKHNQPRWFIFTGAHYSMVAYNATLQGGLFTSSNHTLAHIYPTVYQFAGGAGAGIGLFELETGMHYRSAESKTLQHHKWGYITFRIGF